MDTIIKLIRKYLPPHISVPLILHIIILIGILQIGNLQDLVTADLRQPYEKIPILTIGATATLLYLVLLASYILLCLKIRKNLTLKFGILWDKNKEPYCPIHEKPLSRHKVKINGKIVAGLDCRKCNKESFHIITDEGETLTLEEAKRQL